MYATLDILKKSTKVLGGWGKLTKLVMKKLPNYYVRALKDDAPDVGCMQRGVMASLTHSLKRRGSTTRCMPKRGTVMVPF